MTLIINPSPTGPTWIKEPKKKPRRRRALKFITTAELLAWKPYNPEWSELGEEIRVAAKEARDRLLDEETGLAGPGSFALLRIAFGVASELDQEATPKSIGEILLDELNSLNGADQCP